MKCFHLGALHVGIDRNGVSGSTRSFVCPPVVHIFCQFIEKCTYVYVYECIHHTHTQTLLSLPLKWKLWLSATLVFLPSILGQSTFLQTDKALFKVQCTLLLLHCHQKPLTKCLISLWGYLSLVDLPDDTFGSETWNFPSAPLCCVKCVIEHKYFYREIKDPCILRWLRPAFLN